MHFSLMSASLRGWCIIDIQNVNSCPRQLTKVQIKKRLPIFDEDDSPDLRGVLKGIIFGSK